jgi:glyceraldehyde 3-phosphate dehydrogenase
MFEPGFRSEIKPCALLSRHQKQDGMTATQTAQQYEANLKNWIVSEKQAIELINVVSRLYLDSSVELVLFRRPLFDVSMSQVLEHHQHASDYTRKPIDIELTLQLASSIAKLHLAPSRIDLGRLTLEWLDEGSAYANSDDFMTHKLQGLIGTDKLKLQPKDVVLYGFGRIGRLAARVLIEQAAKGEQLRLRAIVVRGKLDESDMAKRASLLRKDSVHGKLHGTIMEDYENRQLHINGHVIQLIAASSPEEVDYTQYGIHNALLIDNTGAWRDRDGLSRHLKSPGIEKVLLTAPGKGDIPNIVHGVNQQLANSDGENIFSAASCTTNAIIPVIKVVTDNLGIDRGHVETVHAYTNDQNLLDNFHKKYRRGRSAALNMVITETGAESAIAKVIPALKGKFTGNAVRVPTPDVSLAILNLTLSQPVDKEQLNNLLRKSAKEGALIEQIEFSTSNELVSSDVIGNPHASVVDGPATIVSPDGRNVVLYVWYDNEYGYTRQVIRLSKHLARVLRLTYY